MGVAASACKINFERMQQYIDDCDALIIHTMAAEQEYCLIERTLKAREEVVEINKALNTLNSTKRVVIYGANACDPTIVAKYNQLLQLGFSNVMVYPGGMFEWLLLQDIYGNELFPTSGKVGDMLDYKGS